MEWAEAPAGPGGTGRLPVIVKGRARQWLGAVPATGFGRRVDAPHDGAEHRPLAPGGVGPFLPIGHRWCGEAPPGSCHHAPRTSPPARPAMSAAHGEDDAWRAPRTRGADGTPGGR